MDEIIRQKKRIFNQERWKQHIIDCQSSGLTVQDYCQQQGICRSSFYKWQRVLRLDACKVPGEQLTQDDYTLVKVDYPAAIASPAVPKQPTSISVSLGSAKVEIPQGADPATIKIVLNTLSKLCF